VNVALGLVQGGAPRAGNRGGALWRVVRSRSTTRWMCACDVGSEVIGPRLYQRVRAESAGGQAGGVAPDRASGIPDPLA
jgi:hypothetical protein